jgi:hypothetical protein
VDWVLPEGSPGQRKRAFCDGLAIQFLSCKSRDVNQNKDALKKNDSQLARRKYLRSLTAFYEGVISGLRETTASLLIDDFEAKGKWRIYELYPLMDDAVRLLENGELKPALNRFSFQSLVAYVLKTYAKLVDLESDVLSDNHWESFCKTIKIRNRITHPKNDVDIDITDDELKSIDAGLDWWNKTLHELFKAHKKKTVEGRSLEQISESFDRDIDLD